MLVIEGFSMQDIGVPPSRRGADCIKTQVRPFWARPSAFGEGRCCDDLLSWRSWRLFLWNLYAICLILLLNRSKLAQELHRLPHFALERAFVEADLAPSVLL